MIAGSIVVALGFMNLPFLIDGVWSWSDLLSSMAFGFCVSLGIEMIVNARERK